MPRLKGNDHFLPEDAGKYIRNSQIKNQISAIDNQSRFKQENFVAGGTNLAAHHRLDVDYKDIYNSGRSNSVVKVESYKSGIFGSIPQRKINGQGMRSIH